MMPPLIAVEQLGYLWCTFGGEHACEDCRGRDGQEYYFDPQPGQQPVEGMRKPPLHPYCGCTMLPLMGVEVQGGQEGGSIYGYIKGGMKILGGYWGSNGRSMMDGPVRTKWCGENWSGGKDTRDPNAVGPEDTTPEDDLDEVCKEHDDCYDKDENYDCDRRIVEGIESLPKDPRKWRKPPPESEIDATINFMSMTVFYFKYKMNAKELREQTDDGPLILHSWRGYDL